jgi:DNA-binding FadR family transcriptional regulator
MSSAVEDPERPGPKAAESLARQIEAEIIARGWPVGELLGIEADLLVRYGVSRPVLREAVRLLEHHMVATTRRGTGGGLRVTAPDSSAVASAAALYLDYRGVRISQLYAARATLESRCVELTTARLDEVGIARLRGTVDAISGMDVVTLLDHAHDLEGAIAELSGDPVLTLFVEVLLRLAHQHLTPPEERLEHAEAIERMRRAQLAIADAVLAGDTETARIRLNRYLEAAAKAYRRQVRARRGARSAEVASPKGERRSGSRQGRGAAQSPRVAYEEPVR